MFKFVKNQMRGLFNAFGYNLIRRPPAFAPDEIDIIARIRPLIIDDYGHWAGSRQATDEYFTQLDFRPLLNRLDYTARLAIKPAL